MLKPLLLQVQIFWLTVVNLFKYPGHIRIMPEITVIDKY
jgi:hypothetical protein